MSTPLAIGLPTVDLCVQNCLENGVEMSDLALDLVPETWQHWLTVWVAELLAQPAPYLGEIEGAAMESVAIELTLRLTDDAEIQALNRQYRGIDRPTDVLAFAALEELPTASPGILAPDWAAIELGDVVISLPTAQRQAIERGHSLETEVAWLAAHGVLHLLGWDHPDEASLQTMLDHQARLLARVGMVPPVFE